MVIKFLKLQLGQFDKLDWRPDQNFWKLNLVNKYIFGRFSSYSFYVCKLVFYLLLYLFCRSIYLDVSTYPHISITPHFQYTLTFLYILAVCMCHPFYWNPKVWGSFDFPYFNPHLDIKWGGVGIVHAPKVFKHFLPF